MGASGANDYILVKDTQNPWPFRVPKLKVLHRIIQYFGGIYIPSQRPYIDLISADPGLRQGRGGAWDHRRCGACFCWLATTLPSARHTGHCPLLLRAFKPVSSRHSGHCPLLLRAFKPAVCHLKRCAAASSRHSGHCPLLLRAFKPAVCQASNASNARGSFEQALRPLPSVVKGVQACRLPGLKCLKRCVAASSRHSGHCPMLLRTFKPAVCQASNASNAARQLRAGTQATALCC